MMFRRSLLLPAIMATAVGVQAQVQFKPDTSALVATNIYSFTDVSATVPPTPVEVTVTNVTDSSNVSGVFSGGSGAFTVDVTAAYGFDPATALTEIAAGTFSDYVENLPNALVNNNFNGWNVNSAVDGNIDADGNKLNNGELIIYDWDLSGLSPDTELSILSFDLGAAAANQRLLAYLYNPADNSVVYNVIDFADDLVPHSFTNRIYNGSRLFLSTDDRRAATTVSKIRVDFMNIDAIAPPPPTNAPPVIVDTSVNNTQVELDWFDDKNLVLLDHYDVYRSLESNANFRVVGSPTESAYSDLDVTNNVSYYYKLKAVATNDVATAFGNTVSNLVPFVQVPTGLSAESGNQDVVLTWDVSSDRLFESFNVYRGYNDTYVTNAIATDLVVTTFADTNVVNELSYFYAVSIVDSNGQESAKSSLTLGEPTKALVIVNEEDKQQGDIRSYESGVDEYFADTPARSINGQARIGAYDLVDSQGNNQLARPTLSFPLQQASLGNYSTNDIEKVTLRIYTHMNSLTNAAGYATNVVAFHSQTRPANINISTADWDNSVNDGWAEVGVVPDLVMGAKHGWYEIDVTAQVLADLSRDVQDAAAGSSFQFRANGDDVGSIITNVPNFYATGEEPFEFPGWEPVTTVFDGTGVKFNDNQASGNGGTGSPWGKAFIPQLKIKFSDNRSGYLQWTDNYLPLIIGVGTVDYDEDGLDNLHEYGIGGDPTDPMYQGVPSSFAPAAGGGFEYIHPKLAGDSNVVYTVETRDFLQYGSWTNIGYIVGGTDETGGDLDYVTNFIDTTVDDQKFIRLKVDYSE